MRSFLAAYCAIAIFVSTAAAQTPATGAKPTNTKAQKYDPYAETLRLAGLKPTEASLREYLLSLIPNNENLAEQKELIAQLGHKNYALREEAEAKLATMPAPPLDLLHEAAESNDPEIRFRAIQVLKQIDEVAWGVTPRAVFGTIASHQIKGLAFPIMQFFPYWDDTTHNYIAQRALLATVTKNDVDLLRKVLEKKSSQRRAVAILALVQLLKEESLEDLRKGVIDDDPLVRLAAAEAMANIGQREALEPLVKLLADEDPAVRHRAAVVLQQATRAVVTYNAYDPPERREESIEQWRKWLENSGNDAKMHFPLPAVDIYHGRTLMSLYPGELREIDNEGNVLLEQDGFTYVWGCHATSDGFRIVIDYNGKYLIEFDADGDEVWRKDDLPGAPTDCRRLSEDRFLLAFSDPEKIVEMDHKGDVLWSIDLPGRPTTAERLPNGNTLVNLQFGKRVVEVDREGKIVWELGGLDNALTSQALPNGNVLVCEMNQGKVVEYNRDKKVVWKREGFTNTCQAQRLPTGNTLVSDSKGMHEVAPDGKIVWTLEVPRGRFWRY